MARNSLLRGSVWKTQSDERRTTTLAEAEQERESAFADLVILIDDVSEDIAEQHTKPLDAARAETAYLNQLRQVLEVNGPRIAAHFATDSGANQAQPEALEEAEQRAVQAERELDQANANQDRLRDEARHASNLQALLDQANAEIIRITHQAALDADQPNPLAGRVTELEDELTAANTAKDAAEAEATRLQGELDQANADKVAAEQSANQWHQQAIDLGYVEPGSPPEPDPEPEPPVDPPAPTRERRRFRDALPGHGRNQGAQDGGEQ